MRYYQIGQKPPGPWTNLTPPIRGGVYCKEEDLKVEKDASLSGNGDGTSPRPEVEEDDEKKTQNVRQRSPACREIPIHTPAPTAQAFTDQLSPSDFTDWAVQQGIDLDTRDYPSLDPDVQLDIAHKYRILHKKVRDQGLYTCRGVEYGKEMIRYVGLFLTFAVALRYGWYMTSAVFLGLFWVCQHDVHCPQYPVNTILAPNYVHRTRCRAPRHHTQLCVRHTHWYLYCRFLLRPIHWLVEEQSQCSSSHYEPSGKLGHSAITLSGSLPLTAFSGA